VRQEMRHRDLGRQGGGEGQLTVSLFSTNETLALLRDAVFPGRRGLSRPKACWQFAVTLYRIAYLRFD
jgi:hypothetical protein